jgi:hypothetical protein
MSAPTSKAPPPHAATSASPEASTIIFGRTTPRPPLLAITTPSTRSPRRITSTTLV